MAINLSPRVAEGLEKALSQDFYGVENPERMAWVVLVLKKLDDNENWFPHGKWATIQNIESQLDACAEISARR